MYGRYCVIKNNVYSMYLISRVSIKIIKGKLNKIIRNTRPSNSKSNLQAILIINYLTTIHEKNKTIDWTSVLQLKINNILINLCYVLQIQGCGQWCVKQYIYIYKKKLTIKPQHNTMYFKID